MKIRIGTVIYDSSVTPMQVALSTEEMDLLIKGEGEAILHSEDYTLDMIKDWQQAPVMDSTSLGDLYFCVPSEPASTNEEQPTITLFPVRLSAPTRSLQRIADLLLKKWNGGKRRNEVDEDFVHVNGPEFVNEMILTPTTFEAQLQSLRVKQIRAERAEEAKKNKE